MSAPFIIGPDEERKIKDAVAAAKLTPITLDQLKRAARPEVDSPPRVTGDRPDDIPPAQVVALPFGWRLNISCEEQPFGPCLHLSLSSPTPKTSVPRPEAFAMILQTLGRKFPTDVVHHWVEDFNVDGKPAGKAVNLVVREPLQ